MAQQRPRARVNFRYQTFTIIKTRRLGHGAYGAVYIAQCDELLCAAKILHPTVLDPLDPGSSKIAERFQQECDLMSAIMHPNIVQFIGMDRDPDTGCPVLIMELLDESLTTMLEESGHPLLYHLQVDISHDITSAVAYLHRNGLVHRDLSSNNVLILARRRAKVADFGMSKLTEAAPRMTPLTMCPGTSAYMPPEALSEQPTYTEKIDCFSEGVLMIQVCTRKWPNPGPRTKLVPFANSPTGTTDVPILEVERRKSHIDMIDPRHPLLVIATSCLYYDPRDRPTAQHICQRVGELKATANYQQSLEDSFEKDRKIDSLQTQLEDKVRQIDSMLEEQSQQIRDKDEKEKHLIREGEKLNELIQIKDKQIDTLSTSLQSMEAELLQAKQQLETRQGISTNIHGPPVICPRSTEEVQESSDQFSLRWTWTKTSSAPVKMYRGDAVTIGDTAYFKTFGHIYTYSADQEMWGEYKDLVSMYSTIAAVNEIPTVFGGKLIPTQPKSSNKLFSLVSEGKRLKCIEMFRPMPTARSFSTAIRAGSYVIVVGGTPDTYGSGGGTRHRATMELVEILDTTRMTWFKAASLPASQLLFHTHQQLSVKASFIFLVVSLLVAGQDRCSHVL